MSAYKMIAYHCRNCGGNTDPEKEYCDYCSGQLMLKRFINSVPQTTKPFRLLIACSDDYVNFNTIKTIDYASSPQRIEVSTLEDNASVYIDGIHTDHSVSANVPLDKRGIFLLNKLEDNKRYDVRVEYPLIDKCIDFKAYTTKRAIESIDAIPNAKLNLVIDSAPKMYDGIKPKNAYCPNCYAPVTSRYGCCDYCGGWVEWVW